MANGDSQQSNEIRGAIMEFMTNAHIGQCGWHIVDQGWRKNGPSKNIVHPHNRTCFQAVISHIQKWIYSWMQSGYCERKEE